MFNIAIVNNDKNNESVYITTLKEKGCMIQQMDLEELTEEMAKIDAVLIREGAGENISQTCELIMKVRNITNCFVWVLSEETTKMNRIIHLQLGADGTFTNETDLEEFSLYIMKTLERRSSINKSRGLNRLDKQSTERKKSFDIRLIPTNYSVKIDGKDEIGLTKLEFRTLELLIDRRGEAVTYEELYENAWGQEEGNKKYRVANLVFHLRKKLDDDSFKSKYIRTIRSRGYMLPNC